MDQMALITRWLFCRRVSNSFEILARFLWTKILNRRKVSVQFPTFLYVPYLQASERTGRFGVSSNIEGLGPGSTKVLSELQAHLS